MLWKACAILLSASNLVASHFVLNIPTSLGFDDDNESQAPCGGFDPASRAAVTSWKTSGGAIGILSTHKNVTWEYKAALVADLNQWLPLTPTLRQTGTGNFCEPQIPGIEGSWLDQPAVLQVIQHGPEGALYQVCS